MHQGHSETKHQINCTRRFIFFFFLPLGFSENKPPSARSLLLLSHPEVRFVIPEALTRPCSDGSHAGACGNAAGLCQGSAPQGRVAVTATGTAGTWPSAKTSLNAGRRFRWYRAGCASPSLGAGSWRLCPAAALCEFCVPLDSTANRRTPFCHPAFECCSRQMFMWLQRRDSSCLRSPGQHPSPPE